MRACWARWWPGHAGGTRAGRRAGQCMRAAARAQQVPRMLAWAQGGEERWPSCSWSRRWSCCQRWGGLHGRQQACAWAETMAVAVTVAVVTVGVKEGVGPVVGWAGAAHQPAARSRVLMRSCAHARWLTLSDGWHQPALPLCFGRHVWLAQALLASCALRHASCVRRQASHGAASRVIRADPPLAPPRTKGDGDGPAREQPVGWSHQLPTTRPAAATVLGEARSSEWLRGSVALDAKRERFVHAAPARAALQSRYRKSYGKE